jgi:hypothetical protein
MGQVRMYSLAEMLPQRGTGASLPSGPLPVDTDQCMPAYLWTAHLHEKLCISF